MSRAAGDAGIAAIVGLERPTAAGRLIVSAVVDAAGEVVGEQVKTQIDPSEEPHYVPGAGRSVFEAGGLTFGVAICHEAFRYPEITRALALSGAQVVFVPHYVTTGDGSLPAVWCDAANPYNEKALLCRALENSIYVAASTWLRPTRARSPASSLPTECLSPIWTTARSESSPRISTSMWPTR